MKTTFKKTLVATALIAAAGVSSYANAAIVKQVATKVSQQGIGATVAAGTVNVVLKAEYAVGDTFTIKFPGATFAAASAPALVGLAAGAGTDTKANALTSPAGTITATTAAGLTFGLLSAVGDTLTYRVTALDKTTTPTTINNVLELTGVTFTGASVTASKAVNVGYAAQTSTGLAIDVATTNNGKLIAAEDQFSLEVTKLDGVIDVEDDRLSFEGAVLSDVLTLELESAATSGAVTPAADAVTFKVTGNFSFLDANSNGTISTAELAAGITGVTAGADNLVAAADLGSITFTGDVNTAYAVSFVHADADADGQADKVINAGAYSVTSAVEYGTSGEDTYTESAGAWTLNGSTVRVPYLIIQNGRFGSILNVTNHSAKDGTITIDVFGEDGTLLKSNYPAGTSKAGSVTSVATAVRNALTEAGKDLNTATKFSVQIVTNVPEDDVIVYAAYTDSQNGGERAIVNNDSKVQTK
jgi:hypothetical protein